MARSRAARSGGRSSARAVSWCHLAEFGCAHALGGSGRRRLHRRVKAPGRRFCSGATGHQSSSALSRTPFAGTACSDFGPGPAGAVSADSPDDLKGTRARLELTPSPGRIDTRGDCSRKVVRSHSFSLPSSSPRVSRTAGSTPAVIAHFPQTVTAFDPKTAPGAGGSGQDLRNAAVVRPSFWRGPEFDSPQWP